MNFESFAIPGALLVTLTASLMLILDDWRFNIGLLAIQYLGVFALIGQNWPLAMNLSLLVAGWIGGAVLSMAMLSLPEQPEKQPDIEQSADRISRLRRRFRRGADYTPNWVFLLLSISLVALVVFSQMPHLVEWIPGLGYRRAWGGLILIGTALLHLGFYSQPLRVTIGLLTLFSGFLILYTVVNVTTLTAALSATISLALALTGAYLSLAPYMEPRE